MGNTKILALLTRRSVRDQPERDRAQGISSLNHFLARPDPAPKVAVYAEGDESTDS